MSHEIQLSTSNPPLQPLLTPPQLPATTGLPEQTPLRRVHRLLRGRYALAVVLAAMGAAAGATAGIMLPKPSWKSTGVIAIKPTLNTPSAVEIAMPMYQQYVADIVVRMHTDRVIKLAMMNPEWRKHRPFTGDVPPSDQVLEFGKNLTVKQMPLSPQNIEVDYEDNKPDAKEVVQVAVSSVIGAFRDLLASSDPENTEQKITLTQNEIESRQREIDVYRSQIAGYTQTAGDDDRVALEDELHRQHDLERQLKDAQELYQQALKDRTARENGTAPSTPTFTAEEIEPLSPHMSRLLSAVSDAQHQVTALRQQGLLDKSKSLDIALTTLRDRNEEAKAYVLSWNQDNFIQPRPDGSVVAVRKDISSLKDRVDHLQKDLGDTSKQIDAQYKNFRQIQDLQTKIARLDGEIQQKNQNLDALKFQQQMGGRFSSVDDGGVPQPGSDRRPVFAALGFLGGGAIPVGLLMLLGLANPRYRFSDEANGENMGMSLLGILPDLPDRLSDPEQASIAAHCVHQIRTMLQISGGVEERRVFAVTSAAPGDGKTSLTLALGLSYAACGTRTLLIDCDLVGAGLTSRMNVNAPEGVLEAIANRSLLEYVRNTDVADVAILPVGSAQTLHASTLSPAALRRLIDEARKQFDTILIDTGPILGSIEASLVCAAADAVVLTVARGQQRPLVEKSINHLVNIGAKLAGVVFNRAQSNDFDRSISGVSSLRSVASGNGHNSHDGPRYGTLGPRRTIQRPAVGRSMRADVINPPKTEFSPPRASSAGAVASSVADELIAPFPKGLSASAPLSTAAPRTIWGLDPQQLHSRYWAAHGVQVVRLGEPSEIIKHAELFLLTDAGSLTLFSLSPLMDALNWIKPQVLFVRLHDGHDRGYRENVVIDDAERFIKFSRVYDASSHLARVALTPDREIAQLWQSAPDPLTGWRRLRKFIKRHDRATQSIEGAVYDGNLDREVVCFLHDMLQLWTQPDNVVGRARRGPPEVWRDETSTIDPTAKFIGPVWVGAGRSVQAGATVIGPAVIWDDPNHRPPTDEIQWLDIEPIEPPPEPLVRSGSFLDRASKRLFDLSFATIAILITLPLYPIVMLAIWLEDGRPFFFAHRRETRGGRDFPCVKFRSMRKDAEKMKSELRARNQADGPQFYIENDPRLTRIGRLLRRYNLDELPQFFNVLAGQMSVVGPRPSPHAENQFCPPWREARLSVRPGLTGLWQIKRTRRTGSDFQEWIKYDIEYVEKRTLGLDLFIVFKTFSIMFGKVSRS